jgi:hypothetical protein
MRRKRDPDKLKLKMAVVLSIFGLLLICQGIAAIRATGWEYRNVYGGYIFAPVGAVIGALLMVAAIPLFRRHTKK